MLRLLDLKRSPGGIDSSMLVVPREFLSPPGPRLYNPNPKVAELGIWLGNLSGRNGENWGELGI